MPVQRRRRHLRIIFFHSCAWDEGRTARFLCQSNEEQSEVATSDYESKVLIGPELTRRKTSRPSIAFFISVAIIRLDSRAGHATGRIVHSGTGADPIDRLMFAARRTLITRKGLAPVRSYSLAGARGR